MGALELCRLRLLWQYSVVGFVIGSDLMAISISIIPVSGGPGPDYYQSVDWGISALFGGLGLTMTSAFWWLRHGQLPERTR
jgi:hypothetical protein